LQRLSFLCRFVRRCRRGFVLFVHEARIRHQIWIVDSARATGWEGRDLPGVARSLSVYTKSSC
jgi:hypothetical protein